MEKTFEEIHSNSEEGQQGFGSLSEDSRRSGYHTSFDEVKALGRVEMPLPDRIPIVVQDQADSVRLFHRAYDMWCSTFDREKLKVAVDTMLTSDVSRSELALLARYLGEVRQVGFIVQTAWIFFSASHKAPDFHVHLMGALGKFKDSVHYKVKRSPEGAASQLDECLAAYPEVPHDPHLFVPADPTSFLKKQRATLHVLSQLVDIKRMTMRQLHHIRKDGSRPLMNV